MKFTQWYVNLSSENLFSQSYSNIYKVYKLIAYNSLLLYSERLVENVFLTSNSVIVNLNSVIIRLAFHDAVEIDLTNSTDFMGPDGCISNTRPNAGLTVSTSHVMTLFEPIWQKIGRLLLGIDRKVIC